MDCLRGFAILMGLLILPGVSHAGTEILFGPEFTVMHFEEFTLPAKLRVCSRMRSHLVDGQPEGAKFEYLPEHSAASATLRSPNGWYFHHHIEGEVIEIRTRPSTVSYFRKYASDMQDAIFVSAANEGFFAAMFRGGGHINVSSEAFYQDRLLFRNFIVDMFNHNELFMGVFGYDTHNALPMQMLPAENVAKVQAVIQAFDDGVYDVDTMHIQFSKDLYSALGASNDMFMAAWNGNFWSGRGKYHAVNPGHMNETDKEKNRLELRGVRPQVSMDMWIRQIDLLDGRIRYLQNIRTPIPLETRVPIHELNVEIHKYDPPIDPQLALRSFYQYVKESGKNWSDHRDYLWPKWVTDGELEKFEKSLWFLKREKNLLQVIKSICERALAKAG